MGTGSALSVLGFLLAAAVPQLAVLAAWKMTSGDWKLYPSNCPQNKGMEVVGIDVGNVSVSF